MTAPCRAPSSTYLLLRMYLNTLAVLLQNFSMMTLSSTVSVTDTRMLLMLTWYLPDKTL